MSLLARTALFVLVILANAPEPRPPQPDLDGLEQAVVRAIEDARRDAVARLDDAEAWGRLGATLQVHGFLEDAEACYRQAVALSPDEFRWAYLLARTRELNSASAEEFIALYEAAAKIDPSYAPVFVRIGLARSHIGRLDTARTALARAVLLAPDLAIAQRSLGEVLLAGGDPGAAVVPLQRAAELAPHDAAAHSALTRAYRMLGEHELAEGSAGRAAVSSVAQGIPDPVLEREVRSRGVSSRHRFERAQGMTARGEYARARTELEAVAVERPDDPDVVYLLGVTLERSGRVDEALALLQQTVELDPDHVRARLEIARLLEARGRLDEAIAHYRRCREVSPRDPRVLVRLGTALADAEDMAGVAEAYAALADLVPEDARIRVNLGTAWLRVGNVSNAIAAFDEALRIDPDSADAHYRLGVAYEQLGRREDALEQFDTAAQLHPGHTAARKRLADAGRESDPSSPESVRRELEGVAQRLYGGDNPYFGSRASDENPRPEAGLETSSTVEAPASQHDIGRFRDVAPDLAVDTSSLCGGAIVEDFDADGFLDIVTSTFDPSGPMSFHRIDGKNGFEDRSVASGLAIQLGGANAVAADYDNDGDADLMVLRGAWLFDDGRIRNSLLRNDGHGNFTDVTRRAGVARPAYPTRVAVWGDYDNDGDLDLYVCNESRKFLANRADYPSQLFMNDGDGTFTDVARQAGVTNDRYCMGAAAGDYDDDGDLDLYVSNLQDNRLYRNEGDGTYLDVARQAGVIEPAGRSSATWFFDYDNDGRLDLFVAGYRAGLPRLYRNRGNGTFENVTQRVGLDRVFLPMGANFGDLDNDGWLDIYLATGDPAHETAMPDVVLRNDRGKRFQDVTQSGGFGRLHEGHAVVFADIDNDGDQDVYRQTGGLYPGDGSHDALFENPGHGNRFVVVQLVGTESNRAGYGARIEVVVDTPQGKRSIHRAVGSVSSSGGSPARQEIGLGDATRIVSLEVAWPKSGKRQVFREVPLASMVRITEGRDDLERIDLPRFDLGSGPPSSGAGSR